MQPLKNSQWDRLKHVRHLALDLDGTLYQGATLFPYTVRALERLRECGIGYTYLTNNSSRSADAYVKKLRHFGLPAHREQIYTSSLACLEYLKDRFPDVKRLFVFGTESMRLEFAQAGYQVITETGDVEPELVVVGFDTELTFPRLCKAAWWIKNGKPFIATHPDRVCPTDQPEVLVDCGSICAALTAATGIKPWAVLGKPDPSMLRGILKKHGLTCEELAMVGDRLYTDMAMARNSGVAGVLVLSGETRREDIDKQPHRDYAVFQTILQLAEYLAAVREHGEAPVPPDINDPIESDH